MDWRERIWSQALLALFHRSLAGYLCQQGVRDIWVLAGFSAVMVVVSEGKHIETNINISTQIYLERCVTPQQEASPHPLRLWLYLERKVSPRLYVYFLKNKLSNHLLTETTIILIGDIACTTHILYKKNEQGNTIGTRTRRATIPDTTNSPSNREPLLSQN